MADPEYILLDDDDDDDEDRVLLTILVCEKCSTLLATSNEFIQDLFPQSNLPYHELLFHTATYVDYGKVEYRVVIRINERDNVEMSYIYCEICQEFAGWSIEAINQGSVQVEHYGENPVIRPGQCILFYWSNGLPVF